MSDPRESGSLAGTPWPGTSPDAARLHGVGAAEDPPTGLITMGQVLGGTYRLERLLAVGGMSHLYEASHVRLPEKRVVIKVLTGEVALLPAARERFYQEARIASRLHHPNIISVEDFNITAGGEPYIVEELLEGEDLDVRLEREPILPLALTRQVFQQVCAGLEAAHALGVVHRDIKPSNIFLCHTPGGGLVAKLLDFGISKVMGASRRLTMAQQCLGTLNYMSPEQASGNAAQVDVRSDVFALGCLLYELLSGRLAFDAESPMQVIVKILEEDPPPLRVVAPQVPAGFDPVLTLALDKRQEARFASVSALAIAVERVFAGAGPGEPRSAAPAITPGPPSPLPAAPAPAGVRAPVPVSTEWYREVPGDPGQAKLLEADVHLFRGDARMAIAAYRKVPERVMGPEAIRWRVLQSCRIAGERHYQAGELEAAIALWESVQEDESPWVFRERILAAALLLAESWESAARTDVATPLPAAERAFLLRKAAALLSRHVGDLERARQLLQEAHRLHRTSSPAAAPEEPRLEAGEDANVKEARWLVHGLTTGRLPASKLFDLRTRYIQLNWRDATWLTCGALVATGLATEADRVFYQRYYSPVSPYTHQGLDPDRPVEELWDHDVQTGLHEISVITAPLVLRARARRPEDQGLPDLSAPEAEAGAPPTQALLAHLASALGTPRPTVLVTSGRSEPIQPVNLLLRSHCRQGFVLDREADRQLDAPSAVFRYASWTLLLRPEFRILFTVRSPGGLAALIEAVMRAVMGHTDLEPRTAGARKLSEFLRQFLPPESRLELRAPAIAYAGLDLERACGDWLDAVGWAMLRTGLLLCGDPCQALREATRVGHPFARVDAEDLQRKLLFFSLSEPFLACRRRLGLERI